MPAIKSSTNGPTKISLFATERRSLANAAKTLRWLAAHHDGDNQLAGDAAEGANRIQDVLARLLANATDKPAAK
jgi:hypothetical protein